MNNKLTAILVDDEQHASERLQFLLQVHQNRIVIIGVFNNVEKAITKINQLNPDVVFLDIQMPGKNGFEVIKALEIIPAVVFVSAYDQYALKAFEENSLDYLLKPVEVERLALTIERLLLKHSRCFDINQYEVIRNIIKPKLEMKFITVQTGNKYVPLRINDIILLEAKDKYISIYTASKMHLIDDSLHKLIEKLPRNFLQIHRSYIINVEKILSIHKHFGSRFIFKMIGLEKINLQSGTFYNSIKEGLELK